MMRGSGARHLVGLALLLATAWLLRGHLPARWDPVAPLDVSARPGPFERYKLARLDADGCLDALTASGAMFERRDDRPPVEGCGHVDAVQLESLAQARLQTPTLLSCRAALSLALWERHVLQREAIARFDMRAARIEHFGSYACRDIAAGGRRSRHARADALDVGAISLEDGRRIALVSGWRSDAGEYGFLRALHRGACRWFDGVLGPDYDAAHRDHLHFERGGGRHCR